MIQHHKKDKGSLQSHRFVERKRTRKIVISSVAVFVFVLFIFTISRLSWISFLQIKTIEIVGADANMASSIRSVTNDILDGDYIGLFSKKNTLIYPKSSIKKTIEHSSPEIDTVHVERNGAGTLSVDIKLKDPNAIICSSLPDFSDSDNNGCFLADKEGYIFKASNPGDINFPKLYIQQGSTTDLIRTKPIETDRYTKLLNFYQKITSEKIKVYGLLLGEEHNELYVANDPVAKQDSDNIAVVYISEKFPIDETYTNFISFWKHMKTDTKEHTFSEIKLQFPPNVYYTEI